MAMYKVRVTVYKTPTGKTMFLPTFVRAAGSFLLGLGIFFFAGLISAMVQTKGNLNVSVIAVFFALALAGTVFGIFLRRWAERSAQQSFTKALAEQERKPD